MAGRRMTLRAWQTFDKGVRWLVWWLPITLAGALLVG